MSDQNWRDIFFTCHDGLRLHARHYAAPGSIRRPAICLAGLTRNSRDFHQLATRLSAPSGHRRDVYCLDYRGRGLSEHDSDWKNYTPYIELLDVLDLMTLQGLHDAAFIGTSRGGIIAMLMAAVRPTAMGCAVLNDIGPTIERDGLTRIIGYVGRIPLPANWEDATTLVRDMNRKQFTVLRDSDWEAVARQWFNDENGLPTPSYDKQLARSISLMNTDGAIPSLWPQFKALTRMPTLVLRGENSDLLSAETVAAMQQMHPNMQSMTVPGQGHAPLLNDQASIETIANFLVRSDSISHRAPDQPS